MYSENPSNDFNERCEEQREMEIEQEAAFNAAHDAKENEIWFYESLGETSSDEPVDREIQDLYWKSMDKSVVDRNQAYIQAGKAIFGFLDRVLEEDTEREAKRLRGK